MSTAIVLRHAADIPAALALVGSLPDATVFAISIDVLVALRKATPGKAHSLWSLAGADALLDLLQRQLALDYADEFGDDSPWYSAGYQLMQFEFEVSAALLAARALASREGVSAVVLFARDGHAPIIGRPYLDPYMETTAEEAIRHACAEASLPLRVEPTRATPTSKPPAFSGRLNFATRLRRRLSGWRARVRLAATRLLRRRYVLAYGELLDYINLVPQLEQLSGEHTIIALGQLSDRQLETWLPRLSWGYLPLHAAVGASPDSREDRDAAALDAYLEKCRHTWQLPPESPLIKVQRAELVRTVLGGASQIRRLADRLAGHPPTAVISANMSYWKTNFFLRTLGRGAATIACQHGGFGYTPPSCLYRGLDAVAVWGESQGTLVREGRFEGALLAESHQPPAQPTISTALPRTLHILLATSSQSNNSAPFFWDDEEYVGFLEALVRTVESAPHLRLTIRNHPRFDHPDAYPPLLEGTTHCRMAGSESMDTSIDNASIVVFFGAFSTLLFEAAKRGRPVAMINAATSLSYADRIATLRLIPTFASSADLLQFAQAPDQSRWDSLRVETLDFLKTYGTLPPETPDIATWLRGQ